MFNIFFAKFVPFMRYIEKYGGARGVNWKNDGALHAGLVRLHACKHTPAPVHPHLHSHTHTHTHTHILRICNTYCFSTATVVS